jgi:tRNA(Ile)-lysidine synthase
VSRLQALASPLQRHVVRRWLSDCGLPSPPASVLTRIAPELIAAAADREPRLQWAGAELTRYRDLLHCSRHAERSPSAWQCNWDGSRPLDLPYGSGRLYLSPAAMPLPPMQVRPRRGGDRPPLPPPPHGSALKKVLQALAIPPWERRRLPLLFAADGELLAAGDLVLSARLLALLDEHASTLRWQPGDDD